MIKIPAIIAALAVLATAGAAQAEAASKTLSFVACPVFRHTAVGRGCWLAEHKGVLYFIGSPPASMISGYIRPELKHQALIEGELTDGPKVCGGVNLAPVSVSVLPEVDERCNRVLPAEGFESKPDFSPAVAELVWTAGARPPPPTPQPPFATETFSAIFKFDSDFLMGPSQDAIERASIHAKTTSGAVEVVGYRMASRLTNGKRMTEAPRRAEIRARKIGEILEILGVDPAAITVRWVDEAEVGYGPAAADLRRVTVTVTPKEAR